MKIRCFARKRLRSTLKFLWNLPMGYKSRIHFDYVGIP